MIGGFRQPGVPIQPEVPSNQDFHIRTHDWCRVCVFRPDGAVLNWQFLLQIMFADQPDGKIAAQIHATMYDDEGRYAAIAFGPFYDNVTLYQAWDRITADPADVGRNLHQLVTTAKEQDEDEDDTAT